jgi:hypothetical protein
MSPNEKKKKLERLDALCEVLKEAHNSTRIELLSSSEVARIARLALPSVPSKRLNETEPLFLQALRASWCVAAMACLVMIFQPAENEFSELAEFEIEEFGFAEVAQGGLFNFEEL